MIAENQKSSQVEKVKVTRCQPGPRQTIPAFRFENLLLSPLAVRPAQKKPLAISEKASAIPPIQISLHDGAVQVNGKEVKIPVGLSGPTTGKAFKQFAGIHAGDALYVQRDSGLQRVRDRETVELVDDAEFTHRRELPVVRSAPRYWGS